MAVTAYGIFATSFAAGVAYLVQGQDDRFAWLPSHKVLDEVAYKSVIIGFPIFATMIILGSWWASIAWSRYWGWDPKETAALVTWLIYAVYLHARNQRSWAGRPGRAAAGRRLRDGAGDVLRLALVQRPARVQRPLSRLVRTRLVLAIALLAVTRVRLERLRGPRRDDRAARRAVPVPRAGAIVRPERQLRSRVQPAATHGDLRAGQRRPSRSARAPRSRSVRWRAPPS